MSWIDYAEELALLMKAEAKRIEEKTPEEVTKLGQLLDPQHCWPTARYGLTEMHAFAARPPSEPARLRREAAQILRLAWGAEDDGTF